MNWPSGPFEREKALNVACKGRLLATSYRADLVCFGSIIVECKALPSIGNLEMEQILNYLKATGFERALLLNFGAPSLQFKRVVMTRVEPSAHLGPHLNNPRQSE